MENTVQKKRIAICYFGKTRATRFIFKSHQKHLFELLKKVNIEYDIFMHNWKTNDNLIQRDSLKVPDDYLEYTLLDPTCYRIDKQDDYLNSLTWTDYCDEEAFKIHGDSKYTWVPKLIKNNVCAQESLRRVTDMCTRYGKHYDYVLYIRPDLLLESDFNCKLFDQVTDTSIHILAYGGHSGYNDKMALTAYSSCEHYGNRITKYVAYKKEFLRVPAEVFCKYCVDLHFKEVYLMPLRTCLIRPNQTRDQAGP